MQNLGAFGRERFLTIVYPLNPPGVEVGQFFFFLKVRRSIRTCIWARCGPTARSDGQVYNRMKVRTDWSESTHGRTV